MKKILSLVLAVVLIVGGASIAFGAASGRITAVDKAIDLNGASTEPSDWDAVRPKDVVEYPLTADMFSWSGSAGDANEPVTRSQLGNVRTVLTGTGTNVVNKHSIVYKESKVTNNKTTAHVRVEFSDTLAGTSDVKFNLNLFLSVGGNRQGESRVRLSGTFANRTEEVWSGDDYVSLADGQVLVPKSFIRDLEIYLGSNVSVRTNVFENQRYYGTASNVPKVEDDKVLNKYGADMTDILYLSTSNLNKAGTRVFLDYANRHVYNAKGEYLGTTGKGLAYSDKYYLTTKNLGNTIDVKGSGTSGGTDTGTDTGTGTGTTKPPATSGTIINKTTAVADTQAAIKKATSTRALVKYNNQGGITAEALQAMAAAGKAANKTVQLNADTRATNNAVLGRLTINPALASKLTKDTKFGIQVNTNNTKAVENHFKKWYSNNLLAISLDHKGSFGMNVNVAARVDLSKLNTKNLYFYSYDAYSNQFARILEPEAWIDANGYLRFTTSAAGEIVVTDGALTKK